MPRQMAELNFLRDEGRRELSRLYECAGVGETRVWIQDAYSAYDSNDSRYLGELGPDQARCPICLTLHSREGSDARLHYCQTCLAEGHVAKCALCNEMHTHGNLLRVTFIDGERKLCCYACLEAYMRCSYCEQYASRDDGDVDNSGMFMCHGCQEHHTTCSECRCWLHHDEERTHPYGESSSYCEACYSENWFRCNACGEEFGTDERVQYRGYNYCSECAEAHGPGPIGSYHGTRRRWGVFLGKKEKAGASPTYGVELEVVVRTGERNALARKLVKEFGKYEEEDLFFLENDGSIGDRGFEIVFHPFSMQALAEGLSDHIRKMLSWMATNGIVSYQATEDNISCGIHISIGRGSYLGPFAEYKLQRLVYENPINILSVSQRRRGDIEQWASPFGRKGNIRHEKESALLAMKKISGHKYCALHFRENGETIECRVFRGTLFYPSFMKNIEFLSCAVEFARSGEFGMRDATWKNFISYSTKHMKEYPNWNRFAIDTGNSEELTVIPPSKSRRRS